PGDLEEAFAMLQRDRQHLQCLLMRRGLEKEMCVRRQREGQFTQAEVFPIHSGIPDTWAYPISRRNGCPAAIAESVGARRNVRCCCECHPRTPGPWSRSAAA